VKHFELILEQNGFNLTAESMPTKLSKDEKSAQKALVDDNIDELFNEFLTTDNILEPKFNIILSNLNYLYIRPDDKETIIKFKEIITNKFKLQEHDAIIRVLKSDDHIDERFSNLQVRSIDAKLLSNNNLKVKVIREFASRYGLSIFNLDGKGDKMDDTFWKLIQQAFKVTRAKPTKFSEIKQLFISLVKATTSKDIIKGKQGKTKKDRDMTVYTLNETFIKMHLELNSLKNKTCKGFSQEVVDTFGLAADDDHFLDCEVSMLDN
jgi:hypothetical protein